MNSTQFTPFDILLKDFFRSEEQFTPVESIKNIHPTDIYEDNLGLVVEVACTGIKKEDLSITMEGQYLNIKHDKEREEPGNRHYIMTKIRSGKFNVSYKISNRYDLASANARLEDGLLTIVIPFSKESKPRTLAIN